MKMTIMKPMEMMFTLVMPIKISSGKPRCTGLFVWGENHFRAVELYRESIEATQVIQMMYLPYMVMVMVLMIR